MRRIQSKPVPDWRHIFSQICSVCNAPSLHAGPNLIEAIAPRSPRRPKPRPLRQSPNPRPSQTVADALALRPALARPPVWPQLLVRQLGQQRAAQQQWAPVLALVALAQGGLRLEPRQPSPASAQPPERLELPMATALRQAAMAA